MTDLNGGNQPPIRTRTLWSWDTTGATPVATGFPQQNGFAATKTGLMPNDLRAFVSVPIVIYGNPSQAQVDSTILGWIRQAEDLVETNTSVLLCQTWIAAQPAQTLQQMAAAGLVPNTASGIQIQGYDYDLAEAAYDFMFPRAQDEGWMAQTLRYRPVQSLTYSDTDFTAIKNTAFIYPLLNQFFRMPLTWNVEDRDFGYVRYVPATNTQMLPLFAMQLALMGFAESVPGAMWMQYTAGLTPFDYQARWSFMKQLVLCEAAVIALSSIQGSINLGALQIDTTIDGMRQSIKYSEGGAFAGLIKQFEKRKQELMDKARAMVSGPMMGWL